MAEVRVAKDPVAVAAGLVTEALLAADFGGAAPRRPAPGGSAAAALGTIAAGMPDGVWARTSLTWVDERCVPVADPRSNRGAALAAGFLSPTPGRLLPLFEDGEAPAAAVARVIAGLGALFRRGLDVTLLGMGEDGHVASLFPGHGALASVEGAAYVPDAPKPPPERITLTLDVLRTAKRTVLLATGEGKRAALERLLAGDRALPAVGLPGLVVVTDLEGLSGRTEVQRGG